MDEHGQKPEEGSGGLDATLGYAILRLTLGLDYIFHSATRWAHIGEFAQKLAGQFSGTLLPSWSVRWFATAITVWKPIAGILLFIGFRTRYALVAGGLLIAGLVFGSAPLGHFTALAEQLIYAVVFFILLLFRQKLNRWSVDHFIMQRSQGANACPNSSKRRKLRPSIMSGDHAQLLRRSQGGVILRTSLPPGIDRIAVRRQLVEILNSNPFRGSRNCSAFLKFVVETALDGDEDDLKERTVGVGVFSRKIDYDAATDPIVRITAGDVRKRLAQYYQRNDPLTEVLISLPVGTYKPRFAAQESPHVDMAYKEMSADPILSDTTALPIDPVNSNPASSPSMSNRRFWKIAIAIFFVGVAVGLARYRKLATRHSPLDEFWAPLVDSSGRVYVIAQSMTTPQSPSGENKENVDDHRNHTQVISLGASSCSAQVVGRLSGSNRSFDFQPSERMTFYELQRGPSVLCGYPDDTWVKDFTKDLRFHFVQNDSHQLWIEDRQDASIKNWILQTDLPYDSLSRDYAIVVRISDAKTGWPMVVIAGLGEKGLFAASRFIRQDDYFNRQMGPTESEWSKHKNIEIVLGTNVVEGISGPPIVLKTHSW